MDVIGHEAPGPDLDVGGAAGAAQEIAIERIVIGPEERLLPAVAALGDMVRDTGNDDPGETGHARTSAARGTHVNKMHCHRNPRTSAGNPFRKQQAFRLGPSQPKRQIT